MARRVWVVPPTWHDEVSSPSAAGSDGKDAEKNGAARRRFSMRRSRPSAKPAVHPDHAGDGATGPNS
jgi:hypothetical protein